MMMIRDRLIATLVVGALSALISAPLSAAEPDKVLGANYPLAEKFNRAFIDRNVQVASVSPQWIGKTDRFWYAVRTKSGTTYWHVDPTKLEKTPLFDAEKVAASLSELSQKPLDTATLSLTRVSVTDDGKLMKFVFDDYQYQYDFSTKVLTKGAKATRAGGFQPSPEVLAQMTDEQRQQFQQIRERGQRQEQQQEQQQDQQKQEDQKQEDQKQGNQTPPPAAPTVPSYKAVSPDKKKYVYAFKHNLYLADEGAEDKAVQLTKDGEEDYSFGSSQRGSGRTQTTGTTTQTTGTTTTTQTRPAPEERKVRPNITWSPDSKAFFVSRTDSRGILDLYLVDSIASPRPKLEQYKYPMPGEEKIRKQELFYCDVSKTALTMVKPKWKDERFSGLSWGKTANELRFIRRDRLQRNLAVCTMDTLSGTEKCLFGESFAAAFLDSQPLRYIDETDELIWWSERSGWGHFYLYGRDGTLKNPITTGAWRAARIVDVDAKNKLIYFVGNAREDGENIYHGHLYRVRFDGTGLTLLDPSFEPIPATARGGYPSGGETPGAYQIVRGGLNHRSSLSPSKKFIVSTGSSTNHAPVSLLYDESGKPIMTLEETNVASLRLTGWRPAESFIVKAADGVTDLYGNMWKPFDFDPKKSYPIIANVYPGPQTEGVTHTFSAYSSTMQMAQLGFIVIQVGHRGGSPERSKAYHSYGYYNLRDYGLVDKKAAIEQLAARNAYIDLNRVGIYGHSGGGFMSAAAVLQPPYNDFFKAAVASAGNHDNNIYNDNWSERYHGIKEVPVVEEKKDGTTTGTEGTRGQGTGGRRRTPPEEQAIEDEIAWLLTSMDPDDKAGVAEMEKQLIELERKLGELKKTKTDAEGKTTTTKADDKKMVEEKAAVKTKFEIKVPTNAELAGNLKGHLMLVHGEIDNNVHPANTMRLADALIKANKRFELLIIPGARHGFGVAQPYFTQRMWDFFSEHLLSDRQTQADIYEKDVKRR